MRQKFEIGDELDFDEQDEVVVVRTERQLLTSIEQILEELLAEARRTNGTERVGAVSSIAIEDRAKGEPAVSSKSYAGSPLSREDVDAALEIHGYAHRRAAELAMNGWAEMVASLTDGEGRS